MSRDLAIDLGTANTLVYAKGKGVVLNEPTVVALDSRSREVLAIGTDAWQMIGRTPGTSWPSGRCAAAPSPTSRSPSGCSPSCCAGWREPAEPAQGAHLRALGHHRRRAARGQGGDPPGRRLGQLPHRAAHGGGHRRRAAIHEPVGNMVVDVGGGTAEMAVISLGGVVAVGRSLRRLRLRRLHPEPRAQPVRRGHRRAHGRSGQDGDRVGPPVPG